MALSDTLMSTSDGVFDAVTDSIVDAGELVVDATFGSPGGGMSGRNLRRALLVLIVLGGIIGIALWKRAQASAAPELPEAAEALAGGA
jgi:hypothetical protein